MKSTVNILSIEEQLKKLRPKEVKENTIQPEISIWNPSDEEASDDNHDSNIDFEIKL